MRPDAVRPTTGATGPAIAEPPAANPQNPAPASGASPRMRVHDGPAMLADIDVPGDRATADAHDAHEAHREPELRSARTDDPEQPPPPAARDWRSIPLPSLDADELDMIYSRYDSELEPDLEEALNILFGANPTNRPSEPLFLRAMPPLPPELIAELTDCGARSLGQNSDGDVLMLHAADFDRARFAARLLEFQTNEGADAGDASSIDDDSAADSSDSDDVEPATALTIAIHWQDADAVALLLKHGADVNRQGVSGKTPLMLAAEQGQTNVARVLCHHPAIDLAAVDNAGENALNYAAKHGHAAVCSLLIFFKMDPNRGSPLATAAYRGHPDICTLLLKAGADVNLDNDTNTPLMLAAAAGQLACCKVLCEHGADLSLRNQQGKSALEYVLSSKIYNFDRIPVLNFLIEQGAPMSAGTVASMVLMAIKADHLDVLQRLAELKKLDVNQALPGQGMPLVAAAAHGRTGIVSLLLENGAHLSVGHTGFLALSHAIVNGNVDVVRLLLAAGAPVDTPLPSRNHMPLVLRCFENTARTPAQREVLELLLECDASLNEVDERGNDALMRATMSGNSDAIALLMAHGAAIGQINQDGKTALALAVMRVDEALENALLKPQLPWRVVDMLQLMKPLAPRRRDQLAADAARSATQPLARELVLAKPLRDIDHAQAGIALAKGDLDLAALLRYLPTIANAARGDWDAPAMAERLALAGLPLDIARMMQEYFTALPALRIHLAGPGRLSADSNASRSLLAGICATAGKLAVQLEQTPAEWPTYRPLDITFTLRTTESGEPLDINLAHVMRQVATATLGAIVDYGITTETELIAPVFNDLFGFCIAHSAAAPAPQSFDARLPPPPGAIARPLLNTGIYAVLANAIDAAWQAAWRSVSTAGTPDRLPTAPLQRAFLHELAGRVAIGAGILSLPNMSEPRAQQDALAAIYAELVHRQLSLLTQYIERETSAG